MAAFEKGDKVAWSHTYATAHAEGSIIRRDAIEAAANDVQFGVVKKVANTEGTYFDVLLEGGDEPITLTADELVKVAD